MEDFKAYISRLEDEFYGKEDDDDEGVFENNDDCAEWARSNMDYIFIRMINMSKEIEVKSQRLSEATDLLSEAHDLLDDVHCYETDTYEAISKFLNGDDEVEE